MDDGILRFKCTGCSKVLKASVLKAGISATCPACKASVSVPQTSTAITVTAKPIIIDKQQKQALDKVKKKEEEKWYVEPLPQLEMDEEPTSRPHVIVINQQAEQPKEIVRYVEVPQKKKKKKNKSQPTPWDDGAMIGLIIVTLLIPLVGIIVGAMDLSSKGKRKSQGLTLLIMQRVLSVMRR